MTFEAYDLIMAAIIAAAVTVDIAVLWLLFVLTRSEAYDYTT